LSFRKEKLFHGKIYDVTEAPMVIVHKGKMEISNQLSFSLWDARGLLKKPAKEGLILGVEQGTCLAPG
jgi:hypothetical protein